MPDRCCVPACHSNYDGQSVYTSVFKFPKDENLRLQWIARLSRENFVPTTRSVVCEKHFSDEDIIKFDDLPDEHGNVLKIPRVHPKLRSGAIPSIFPECPKHLTNETPEITASCRVEMEEEVEAEMKETVDRIDDLIRLADSGPPFLTSDICVFIRKLWALLHTPEHEELISWSQDGQSIIIKDKVSFEERLLPLFFRCGFPSFVRQLYGYGFKKLVNVENSKEDDWHFQNAYFIKGRQDLLKSIKRIVTKRELFVPVTPFIQKLWKLLDSPEFADVISWCPEGTEIIIKNREMFEQRLMPLYFRCSFESFIRHLNIYGFKKVFSLGNTDKDERFKHPFFIRDRQDLLELVKRNEHRKTKTRKHIKAPIAEVLPFLQKVWNLVDTVEYNHIVLWSEDGKSFIITDKDSFEQELMPLFFKGGFLSFIRQLNLYGFKKMVNQDKSSEQMQFRHHSFTRGRPDLLKSIKPNNPKSKKKKKSKMNEDVSSPGMQELEAGNAAGQEDLSSSVYVNGQTIQTRLFVKKLWELLGTPEYAGLIYWSQDGKSFIIKNKYLFEQQILPLSFRCSIHGFVRQLNFHGFKKMLSLENGSEDEWHFHHPMFIRGREDLLNSINKETAQNVSTDHIPPFIQKLWKVINTPNYSDLIRWSQDGRSFFIEDRNMFEQKIIPLHFRCTFSSFVRQLNIYGFDRVERGIIKGLDNSGVRQQYEHPYFERGREDLLKMIKRKQPQSNRKRNFKSEIQSCCTFVLKLWALVDSPEYDDVISWTENGSSFIIKDENVFEQNVLRTYFQARYLRSFIRNLSFYGFRKVSAKAEYAHPHFLRGRKDLIRQLKVDRTPRREHSSKAKSQEENLSNTTSPEGTEENIDVNMDNSEVRIKEEPCWEENSSLETDQHNNLMTGESMSAGDNGSFPSIADPVDVLSLFAKSHCEIALGDSEANLPCVQEGHSVPDSSKGERDTKNKKKSLREIKGSAIWSSFDVFPFIKLIWKILSASEYDDVISWNEEGDGIVIKDESLLAKKLFPRDANHKSILLFKRMLRNFGFKKTKSFVNGVVVQYHHPWFIKGREDLLVSVYPNKIPLEKVEMSTLTESPEDIETLAILAGFEKSLVNENIAVMDTDAESSEEEDSCPEVEQKDESIPQLNAEDEIMNSCLTGIENDLERFWESHPMLQKSAETRNPQVSEAQVHKDSLCSIQKMQECIKNVFIGIKNEHELFMSELLSMGSENHGTTMKRAPTSPLSESFGAKPIQRYGTLKSIQACQEIICDSLRSIRQENELILINILKCGLEKSASKSPLSKALEKGKSVTSKSETICQYVSSIKQVQIKAYSSMMNVRKQNELLWLHLSRLDKRNEDIHKVLPTDNQELAHKSACGNLAVIKDKEQTVNNLLSYIINQNIVLQTELLMMNDIGDIRRPIVQEMQALSRNFPDTSCKHQCDGSFLHRK